MMDDPEVKPAGGTSIPLREAYERDQVEATTDRATSMLSTSHFGWNGRVVSVAGSAVNQPLHPCTTVDVRRHTLCERVVLA